MLKIEKSIVKFIIILLILSNINVFAQKNPNEFSIYGGGGLSFFVYQKPANNVFSMGYHGDAGIGYTAFVGKQCGFHIGAGFGLFHVKTNVGDLVNFTPDLIDEHNYPFDLYTTLMDYSEIHKTMYLTVPLLFHFQTKDKQSKNWKKGFYATTGVKLLVMFNRMYDSKIATLANAAYYPEFDNWTGTQVFAGLGEFVGKNADGKLGTALIPMFTFETGIKWKMNEKVYLYTGIYYDCGLNDPTKKERKHPDNYTAVEHLANLSLLDFYNKNYLMNVGIKLRVAFHKIPERMPCPYSMPQRIKIKNHK